MRNGRRRLVRSSKYMNLILLRGANCFLSWILAGTLVYDSYLPLLQIATSEYHSTPRAPAFSIIIDPKLIIRFLMQRLQILPPRSRPRRHRRGHHRRQQRLGRRRHYCLLPDLQQPARPVPAADRRCRQGC